jgi:hypothetical protein
VEYISNRVSKMLASEMKRQALSMPMPLLGGHEAAEK